MTKLSKTRYVGAIIYIKISILCHWFSEQINKVILSIHCHEGGQLALDYISKADAAAAGVVLVVLVEALRPTAVRLRLFLISYRSNWWLPTGSA